MRLAAILALIWASLALSACSSQAIDPNRPPLDKNYEPPPIGSWPEQQGRGMPGRV